MKLKEYYDTLTKMLEDNPEAGDLNIITSRDDEGNGYNDVVYTPTVGYYNERGNEFYPESQFKEEEITEKPNSICMN